MTVVPTTWASNKHHSIWCKTREVGYPLIRIRDLTSQHPSPSLSSHSLDTNACSPSIALRACDRRRLDRRGALLEETRGIEIVGYVQEVRGMNSCSSKITHSFKAIVDDDGPKILYNTFDASMEPCFGIRYDVGSIYETRILGLNSHTLRGV